jgi:hypothetical protein
MNVVKPTQISCSKYTQVYISQFIVLVHQFLIKINCITFNLNRFQFCWNIGDLYRGIKVFKKGYQPRTDLVKDENGDLLANCHNILNRWKNYFSQLLSVHRVSDVKQIEIHTIEPLVPDPSPFEIEIAIATFKQYKSPGSG